MLKQRKVGWSCLTINDYPHILNKTVDNFEGLRCSGTSLIEGQSIESL
jgi:hypothetical protein